MPSMTFVATRQRDRLHRRDAGVRRHRRARPSPGCDRGAVEAAIDGAHEGDHDHGLRRPSGRDRGARARSRAARGLAAARGRRPRGRLAARRPPPGDVRRGRRVQLLLEQEPGGRRGRHGGHRRRRRRRADAAAALARDDDADLGPPPRPRVRLRRRRARLQLPHRRAARGARPAAAWRASTPRTRAARELDARYREPARRHERAAPSRCAPGAERGSAHHLFTIVLDEGVERAAFRAGARRARASRRACTTRPRTASRSTQAPSTCP